MGGSGKPFQDHSNLGESLYASYLTAVSQIPFEEFSLQIKSSGDTDAINQFLSLDLVSLDNDRSRYAVLEQIYRGLSEESQKYLFESAFQDSIYSGLPVTNPLHVNITPNRQHQINFLKQWYQYQNFWFKEPIDRISKVEAKRLNRNPTKIPVNKALKLIKEIQEGWGSATPGDIVNVHSLSPDTEKQSKHNVIAKRRNPRGTIRIFKLSEGTGWRDATPRERYVYNKYLQAMDYFFRSPYEENSQVYGILDKNNTFYLVNNLESSGNAGRECANFTKTILMQVMQYLGVPAPNIVIDPEVTTEIMRSIVITNGYAGLLTGTSQEQAETIEYIYRVINSGRNDRSDMCSSILNFMAESEQRTGRPYIWRF
jgi:hypothetical protein